ncbi:heavy metal translocating P-type ATPase, partial [Pedobacter sp. P351]
MENHQHNQEHVHQHVEHSAHKPTGTEKEHSEHSSHDEHMGHHTEDFLRRFWICLILTIPVLLLSEMIQHWFGYHLDFPGSKFVLLGLSTIIFVYGGKPFLTGMVREIR